MVKKLDYITLSHTIGIFLIVLLHSTPEVHHLPSWQLHISHFIQSFVMPMFVAVSGFLYFYTTVGRDMSYISFLGKKAKRLLVPYIAISTVGFIIKVALSNYTVRSVSFSLTSYFSGLYIPTDNPVLLLWFLPTLFNIFAISYFLKKLIYRGVWYQVSIQLILIAVYVIHPVTTKIWAFHYTASYLVFFFFGMLLAHYRTYWEKHLNWILGIIAFLLLLVIYAYVDNGGYCLRATKLLTSLLGIYMVFSISQELGKYKPALNHYLNDYTYQIYLLSWFFQAAGRLIYQTGYANLAVSILVMLIGGMLLPIVTSVFTERFAPFLLVFIGRARR